MAALVIHIATRASPQHLRVEFPLPFLNRPSVTSGAAWPLLVGPAWLPGCTVTGLRTALGGPWIGLLQCYFLGEGGINTLCIFV